MSLENYASLETLKGLKNCGGSSTVKAAANSSGSSIIGVPPNSSGLSFEKIDARRRKLGISVERLIGEARVTYFTWRHGMKGDIRTRTPTLDRLDRALSRLAAGERQVTEGSLTLLYRTWVGIFARELGVDIAAAQAIACDFSAEKPQNPDWIAAARVRRLAIYTLACAMGQKNADVARAAGCSRQGVGKAIAEIEALRERDTALDAMLDRCARLKGDR
jgi:hypothetical protein